MSFKVEVSELADAQYDQFLAYIYIVLNNPQAAGNLMQDFDETIELLEEKADCFGYCRSERLRELGFHKIHFRRHRYLLVYRVKKDRVQIQKSRIARISCSLCV